MPHNERKLVFIIRDRLVICQYTSASPHLQTLIYLGHQRVEEELNDAALAGGDFGGDAHAWQ